MIRNAENLGFSAGNNVGYRVARERFHADQILVLDNGRLVERGTHEQLLAKKGYYSTVFHHQYGEFDRFKKVRAEKGRGEA